MSQKTSMVFVDDDPIFGELWLSSCPPTIDLVWISDPEKLLAAEFIKKLHLNTHFYVDCELGAGMDGEEVCRYLFELGFTNLFIATCHNQERFARASFLKGIRDKTPPWLD